MKKNLPMAGSGPLLLGIESSGKSCAAALSCGPELLASFTANIKNIHSQKLAPFIEQLLQITGRQVEEVEAIVLSAGPGSFTGLRIGYSVAKGLAHALRIPIVEIPTLEMWAWQSGRSDLPLLPIIDAHRNEVYTALYQWQDERLLQESEYQILGYGDLAGFLTQPVRVCGADAVRLSGKIKGSLPAGSEIVVPQPDYPQIWALMQLGIQGFEQERFSSSDDCEPLYLRPFQGVL